MVHKCLETTPEVGITQLHNLGHTSTQLRKMNKNREKKSALVQKFEGYLKVF